MNLNFDFFFKMNASNYNIISYTTRGQTILSVFRRLKSSKTRKEKERSPCSRALDHFDDFYGAVFLKNWPSIRLGLLSRPKQLAIINNFGDVRETEELLANEGAINFQTFLNTLKKNFQNDENIVKQKKIPNLNEIILKRKELQQEKALDKIFPKDKILHSKSFYFECKNNEMEENLEKYDPEDPKTSLKSDLSAAQIDTSRLILPDFKAHNSVLHDFIPATQLKGLDGFVPEADYYRYYQLKSDMPLNVEDEVEIDFPENLKVYTFDRGDMNEFPEPKKCAHGVYNYLRVDGGDLLAVLALNIQKEDKVLNFCSLSGNTAFCIFQLLPRFLVCIDSNKKNIEEIFSQYLFDYSSNWKDLMLVTSDSFIYDDDSNLFDKILVNVPCTEDRLSAIQEKNNIFHPKLIKKRLELPKLQSQLVKKALKLVKPGGAVVYTTTTLSPVQNEGVVNEALKCLWEETKMECTVRNLSPSLAHMSEFFRFADFLPMKFGTLIVPFLPTNFGPRYFCKIIKN